MASHSYFKYRINGEIMEELHTSPMTDFIETTEETGKNTLKELVFVRSYNSNPKEGVA
jgi:hypothetical protein